MRGIRSSNRRIRSSGIGSFSSGSIVIWSNRLCLNGFGIEEKAGRYVRISMNYSRSGFSATKKKLIQRSLTGPRKKSSSWIEVTNFRFMISSRRRLRFSRKPNGSCWIFLGIHRWSIRKSNPRNDSDMRRSVHGRGRYVGFRRSRGPLSIVMCRI